MCGNNVASSSNYVGLQFQFVIAVSAANELAQLGELMLTNLFCIYIFNTYRCIKFIKYVS